MKPILDLTKAISDSGYFNRQFGNWGDDKNILFVNPQLSGKCLYKMILPFFSMFNEKVATAISGLSRYDYEGQILGGDEIFLEEEMIEWSDFIVFPFTTQPLVTEFYSKIKKLKKHDTKIVFLVDFNFYELSKNHPYKRVFDEPSALSATEDNIWFSDICLTSNAELAGELVEKFKLLGHTKYVDTESYLAIACMPYMIDTDIVLKNIEYDPIKPILVNPNEHNPKTKKHIEDLAVIAEEIKDNNISEKNDNIVSENSTDELKLQGNTTDSNIATKNTVKENGSGKKSKQTAKRKQRNTPKPEPEKRRPKKSTKSGTKRK